MSTVNQVQLNSEELKNFMEHIISNNQVIQKDGKNPIAVEVIGESGIGKTSTIIQIANEHKLSFVKLNLAQIEELGDLVGFPVRQFKMEKAGTGSPVTKEVTKMVMKKVMAKFKTPTGEIVEKEVEREVPVKEMVTVPGTGGSDTVWVDETAVEEYAKMGYSFSVGSNKRMAYCPPEWIADKTEGGILLLDDWNRADTRFLQAVMELIDRQEYISWKLPMNWHIMLSANPDNGDYLVNTIDVAQRTRFASVELKFEVETWAKWAEQNKIDGRCINFLLMNPEVISQKVNARSTTNFFNSISSVEDFEKSLGLIQNLGEATVGPEAAMLFSQFIANKLDKLITPKQMLLEMKDAEVITALKELVWEDGNYRADLASVFCNRLINYALVYADKNPITPDILKRIGILIKDEDIFNYDLKYIIAKRLIGENKQKFQKLVFDTTVSQLLTV
jgi:MoxR-like ATPase